MTKPKKLSDFKPQRRNANLHTPRGLGMLDNSIAKDGWIGAITVAADGETFDGSARLETVYSRLGEDVEPIIVRSNGDRPIIHIREDIPTAEDERAVKLAIAANRIAQVDLNFDAAIIDEIAQEVDISDLFTDAELSELMSNLDTDFDPPTEEEDEESTADLLDKVESGAIEPRFKLGDVIRLGRHFIACGDSTDEDNVRSLLKRVEGRSVGMVWADPPYGYQYQSNMRTKSEKFEVLANDDRILSDFLEPVKRLTTGWVLTCTSWKVVDKWMQATAVLGDLKNIIVWDKGGGGMGDLAHSLLTDYELILAHNRGQEIQGSRIGSVWSIGKDAASEYVHATQKPVSLLEQAFASFSKSNDLIFDPFLGSAPSIIAAQKMEGDRTVAGFELSPDYIEVICRRYESFTGQTAQLVGHL
jgi:DNA modification methylase